MAFLFIYMKLIYTQLFNSIQHWFEEQWEIAFLFNALPMVSVGLLSLQFIIFALTLKFSSMALMLTSGIFLSFFVYHFFHFLISFLTQYGIFSNVANPFRFKCYYYLNKLFRRKLINYTYTDYSLLHCFLCSTPAHYDYDTQFNHFLMRYIIQNQFFLNTDYQQLYETKHSWLSASKIDLLLTYQIEHLEYQKILHSFLTVDCLSLAKPHEIIEVLLKHHIFDLNDGKNLFDLFLTYYTNLSFELFNTILKQPLFDINYIDNEGNSYLQRFILFSNIHQEDNFFDYFKILLNQINFSNQFLLEHKNNLGDNLFDCATKPYYPKNQEKLQHLIHIRKSEIEHTYLNDVILIEKIKPKKNCMTI